MNAVCLVLVILSCLGRDEIANAFDELLCIVYLVLSTVDNSSQSLVTVYFDSSKT